MMAQQANEINYHATRKDIEKLYRLASKNMSAFKEIKQKKEYDPNEMRKHFAEQFKTLAGLKTPKDLMQCPEYIKKLQDISMDSIKCGPPSFEEIVSTRVSWREYLRRCSDRGCAYAVSSEVVSS